MSMSHYRFLQIENAFRRSHSDYKGMAIELIEEIRRCQNIIEVKQSRINFLKAYIAIRKSEITKTRTRLRKVS